MSTTFLIIILVVPAIMVMASSIWIVHLVTQRLAEHWSKPNPALEANARVALQTANLLKAWLENEAKKTEETAKTENRRTLLPLKLQACERLTLMLERINLTAVMMRLSDQNFTTAQLQLEMIRTIRDEFEHNITQQLFISQETWNLIKAAREEALALIKQAAAEVGPEEHSTQLMVKIIEAVNKVRVSSNEQAINALRVEINALT